MWHLSRVAFGISIAVVIGGCCALGDRTRASAISAAQDPWTWGPIAGAGLVAATQSDRRISDWARRKTPVFGSTEDALDAEVTFGNASRTSAWLIFAFADKRGDSSLVTDKGIDAGANLLGVTITRDITLAMKRLTRRERPATDSKDSFPSARASDAFAHASFGRYYADRLSLEPRARVTAQWTASTFAAGAAWARVEAGGHFPTDILVGAAVGNFTTLFFTELLAPNAASGWRIAPQANVGGDYFVMFSRPF